MVGVSPLSLSVPGSPTGATPPPGGTPPGNPPGNPPPSGPGGGPPPGGPLRGGPPPKSPGNLFPCRLGGLLPPLPGGGSGLSGPTALNIAASSVVIRWPVAGLIGRR